LYTASQGAQSIRSTRSHLGFTRSSICCIRLDASIVDRTLLKVDRLPLRIVMPTRLKVSIFALNARLTKIEAVALSSQTSVLFDQTGGHSPQSHGWIRETCLSELPMARSSRSTLSSSVLGSFMCNVWMCDTPKCDRGPRSQLTHAELFSLHLTSRLVR
jgi:hypothetical protein